MLYMQELMQRMDADGNGEVDFQEFVNAMAGQQEEDELGDQLQELQDVFSLFDADGSGQLSADEVRYSCRRCGIISW
jgi:calmodulin